MRKLLDFDSFREIISVIKRNRMRTLLTGFAVAWGILMLIILLGAGNGLKHGVERQFDSYATNAMGFNGGWTSMPYRGLPPDRPINMDHRDLAMLREQLPEIEYISAGVGQQVTLTYKNNYTSAWVSGVTPESQYINNYKIPEGKGRFINKLDEDNRRKVLVIAPMHARILFKDEDPIGKYVMADNIAYKVIGVYDDSNVYDNNPNVYAPLNTAQMLYNDGWGYWYIEFTVKGLKTEAQCEAFEQKVREKMGQFRSFDPADRSALHIWNSAQGYIQTQKIFTMLTVFVLIVGLASLMAGLVGVGNIMLITVKERTREFGIRLSLGATPGSILWLVISEAIFITTCAGYVGIIVGVGITELAGALLPTDGERVMFIDPTVDIGTVLWATLFLIVCGVVAGAIPAMKATRISPVEAMKAD